MVLEYSGYCRRGDGRGLCKAAGSWGIQSWQKRSVLLFPVPDEDLAPAVSHDEADAEQVVGGLEAPGGDVALWRRMLASWLVWRW
jgi:hypothetical protein